MKAKENPLKSQFWYPYIISTCCEKFVTHFQAFCGEGKGGRPFGDLSSGFALKLLSVEADKGPTKAALSYTTDLTLKILAF